MADAINVNKHTRELKKKKRLNAKKLDKQEEFQNREEILLSGSDNRKEAIKEIQREQKEDKEHKDRQDADVLTNLESKKRFHDGYKKVLAQALGNILEMLDWIPGWQAYCMATDGRPITIKGKPFSTKDGVLLLVVTSDDRVFHQGIITTGEPILDYSALYTMAAQTENQLDKERNLLLDDKLPDNRIVDQHGNTIN